MADTSNPPSERYRYFIIGELPMAGLIRFDSKRIRTATYNRWKKEFVTHEDDDIFQDAFATVMGQENDGHEISKDEAAELIAALPEVAISIDEASSIITKSEISDEVQ